MAGDSDRTGLESRDIPTAISDAVAEHEQWLNSWRRALLCGLYPDPQAADNKAAPACRFARWYDYNSRSGLLEGALFAELGRSHDRLHEAARRLTASAVKGQALAAEEYDALVDIADGFRKLALRVLEAYGRPEDDAVPVTDDVAEAQSRFNMLVELEREWERASRTDAPLSLVMVRPIGLDDIARDFGRIGLDRAIAGVAARLFSKLRPYDSIFRYGRGAFVLSLPGADAEQGEGIAQRLCEALEEAPFALSESVDSPVAARFGIALADLTTSVQETLDRALRASNMAGAGVGERVVLWSAELEN